MEIAEAVYRLRGQRVGDRMLVETSTKTGESREVSVRELRPGYDRQQWRGLRFVDDWGAGHAGDRPCLRWVLKIDEYDDKRGGR